MLLPSQSLSYEICGERRVVESGFQVKEQVGDTVDEEGVAHCKDFIQYSSFYQTQTNNAPNHSNEQSDYNDIRVQETCLIITFPNLVTYDGQWLTVVIRFVLSDSYQKDHSRKSRFDQDVA